MSGKPASETIMGHFVGCLARQGRDRAFAAILLAILGIVAGCGGAQTQPRPQAKKPAQPKPVQPAPQAIPTEPLAAPQADVGEKPARSKTAPLAGLAAQAANEEFRLPNLDENRIKTAGITRAESAPGCRDDRGFCVFH